MPAESMGRETPLFTVRDCDIFFELASFPHIHTYTHTVSKSDVRLIVLTTTNLE